MPRHLNKKSSAQEYSYPEHLRSCIADLPAAPGIYIFHGDDADSMPLYIGKSVNIRQRVMSHLRTPDEQRMLSQTRSVTHVRTVGEIGALLLEARLIKERQPLFNQRLRRTRQLCSLQVSNGDINVVYARDLNFALEPHLFGLFSSPHAALNAVRELADAQQLCYGALGLERLAAGRRCFRASINQCAGVCCGKESLQAHSERLMTALERMRVTCWPYLGAVGLVERDQEEMQIHVIRNWCYLGSAADPVAAAALATVDAGFDADGYKILCRALLSGAADIVLLS